MSNAEHSPRPEEGREAGPERAPETPNAGAEPGDAHRADPAPHSDTTPPQSTPAGGPAGPAGGGPSSPAEPSREQPERPQPEQAPPGHQEHQTRAMHPGPPVGPPHMTGPNDAQHSWQPHGAPVGPPPGYGPHGPGPQRRPNRGWGKIIAGAVILALLAGLAGGIAGWYLSDRNGSSTVVESVSMDAGAGMTYTEIVDKVSPSVVTIVTDSAEGSGVVYSDEGYIVTNNHVVEGAQALEVRFADGTVAEAEVVATDPTQDLAVVQVSDVDDLQPIEFGDSSALQVGDVTVAIGSPLGLEGTVTTGIVSALNRSMSVGSEQQGATSTLSGLIQTDAAINMGNSGGALVNGSGELIGINTAILSPESGSVGLGFAIPSNTVKDVVEQLIEHGSVEQGFLGVSVTDTQGNGAMVLAVQEGSPAAEAGLEEGDVIIAVDDAPVASASEVVAAVQSKASGDTITITYVRGNEEHTTEATLASR